MCANAATHTSDLNHAASGPSLELQDFSPEWDFTLGGSKVIVTCREGDGEVTSNCPVCIMFDKEQVISSYNAVCLQCCVC